LTAARRRIGDTQVGIVDVPGHENFIKTMVAGATGIDGVILVVAADDGVMPQTREHLEILTLLGVRHGLVALTKIDRVGADDLALAQADVEDLLRGTFLQGAPVLPLSNITGQGFDALFEALLALIASIPPRPVDGVFRLPLERAFSVPGYGTVVTGIPVAGTARAGDEVVLLPQGLSGRIRRIEVYGQPAEAVLAGQCAAINVSHWEQQTVRRGDVIAAPGYFAPQEWFACALRLLPRDKLVLKSGAEVKFHTGTSEVTASIYPLVDGPMIAGTDTLVQLRFRTPLVAGPGDRFILRTPSPPRTIGGGTILESLPRRLKHKESAGIEDLNELARSWGCWAQAGDGAGATTSLPPQNAPYPASGHSPAAAQRGQRDPRKFIEYALRTAEPPVVRTADLSYRAKLPPGRVQEVLAQLEREGTAVVLAAGLVAHRRALDRLKGQVEQAVGDFHRQSPASPGIAADQLRQCLGLEPDLLDGVIGRLIHEGRLAERHGRLALAGHQAAFGGEDAGHAETVEALFRRSLFHPPSAEEIVKETGIPAEKVQRILRILGEHQRLVVIDDLRFHREALDRARQLLTDHLAREGRLESVDFKYLLDTTRKFALPLLDYFDRQGLTRRAGNTRFPR
jgi:selenocysteine-specific elongation factor